MRANMIFALEIRARKTAMAVYVCRCARNGALPLRSVRKIDDSTSKQILT